MQEGLVNVNDPLLDYFPECKDLDMDPRAREITLRDVLTMSTGHERDTVGDMCNSEGTPWPEIFFTGKMAYAPGEHFVYNSGGTYMLSEVISRATGKSLFQWLREKLFEPLGITDVSWDVNGKVNTGAWGLLIAPRDLCKVGALYLNKGLWNGQRLLSEEWIDEATAPHVPTLGQGCAGWGCSSASSRRRRSAGARPRRRPRSARCAPTAQRSACKSVFRTAWDGYFDSCQRPPYKGWRCFWLLIYIRPERRR